MPVTVTAFERFFVPQIGCMEYYPGDIIPDAYVPFRGQSSPNGDCNPYVGDGKAFPDGTTLPTTLGDNDNNPFFVLQPAGTLHYWDGTAFVSAGTGGGSTEYGTIPDYSTLLVDYPSPNVGDTAYLLDSEGTIGGSTEGLPCAVRWNGTDWEAIALYTATQALNITAYSDSVINVPKIDTLRVPNEGRFVAPVLPIITGDDTYDAESDYITDAVEGMMVLHHNIIDNLYFLAVYSGGQWRGAAPFNV